MCFSVDQEEGKAANIQISEIHASQISPVSPTEYESFIVMSKNAVHVGYEHDPSLSFPTSTMQFGDPEGNPKVSGRSEVASVSAGVKTAFTSVTLYPDVVSRRSPKQHLPQPIQSTHQELTEIGRMETDNFALQELFAEETVLSQKAEAKSRAFLSPTDIVGSPTPSGSTTAPPDGALDYSGDVSIINEGPALSAMSNVSAGEPSRRYGDRLLESRSQTAAQQLLSSVHEAERLSNPVIEIMDRFCFESVPHVAVSFSSSDREAAKQVLGELRSLYLFITPDFVTTSLNILNTYKVRCSKSEAKF